MNLGILLVVAALVVGVGVFVLAFLIIGRLSRGGRSDPEKQD